MANVLVLALVGIAVGIGLALLLYNFAHDTTETVVTWGLIIRRGFLAFIGLLFALAFLFSGSVYLVFFGALMLMLGVLTLLFDPTFKPLKGAV